MSSPTITGTTVIGGRYVVERQLGYGATSTVYLCRDREATSLVAVKVLRPELAESLGADRFLREIRLTAGLEHPNIVPVIDSGAEGSTLYCVLPYMEGGTLRDVLLASKQLPIDRAIDIGCTIARALAYAHAKGLIHRDIKPENILFGNGRPYLGDFGIARLLHATAGDLTTTTGVVRGTPAYMSPEQASGERDYDGRSDVYSLAAVVYEMVSGMPPFTGPTAQSVLAQRFSTTPRPMRTYRNTVSPELERVIAKAMCTSPADRQATAAEFADQLESANRSNVAGPGIGRWGARRVLLSLAASVLVVAGVSATARQAGWRPFASAPPIDTAQIAVLPFERHGNTDSLGSVDAFVYDAFSAWRGLRVIEPFQVHDAFARRQGVSGVERDRAVAIALGAGRFVRGSVDALPAGGGWRVAVSLHEITAGGDTTLFSHAMRIRPGDLGTLNLQYAGLAGALLSRGADTTTSSAIVTTRVVSALQAFTRGIAAVDEWDFATADTQFQKAIAEDPDYRRAYLWLAQVRFWQRMEPVQWASLASKALVDTTRLPTRDRQLAAALAALGKGDYDGACRSYDALRRVNDADYAAWFGLARCRDLDFRIVRDSKSPTGWRYRASYAEAVRAYQKAFEVLSLAHRGLERGAFEPLRELLFMRPAKLQQAIAPGRDSGLMFVGRLDWENGEPILRPIPAALIAAADPAGVPAGMLRAIDAQQHFFGSIATSWSAALPQSAVAKEAVAVALEMRGERSALDTLREARRYATEGETRLRLASAEAVMRLKFAEPHDSAEYAAVRDLADSLLAAHPSPTARFASYLLPMAVMTGRCVRAGVLARLAPFSNGRGAAQDVVAAADALTTTLVMGCANDGPAEIRRISKRLETTPAPSRAIQSLLPRAVQMTQGADSALTADFATLTGAYLLKAQQAFARHRTDSVRQIFARLNLARARTGYDDIAPDAIYLESRLLLATGDTAGAVTSLDRLLARLPFLTPGMLNHPVEMGGLMRAMQLRASIAGPADRSALVGRARRILWMRADPQLPAPPR